MGGEGEDKNTFDLISSGIINVAVEACYSK